MNRYRVGLSVFTEIMNTHVVDAETSAEAESIAVQRTEAEHPNADDIVLGKIEDLGPTPSPLTEALDILSRTVHAAAFEARQLTYMAEEATNEGRADADRLRAKAKAGFEVHEEAKAFLARHQP